MPPELAQWIPPAVIVGVMLYLHRTTRQDMKQMETRLESRFASRMDRMETRLAGRIDGLDSQIGDLREHVDTQLGSLRDRMDSQNGDLRDRLGRIEGNLDVLREYFVRDGRGTAA